MNRQEMKNDEKMLLIALKEHGATKDEIEIGITLGLEESKTNFLLEKLQNEGKIEFVSFGICSYIVKE